MTALVYSMTGYATLHTDVAEQTGFTLVLKGVNHRFLDLQVRLPQNCDALETQIRKVLKQQIQRGHVEFSLQLDRQVRAGIAFNDDQIAAYVVAFRAAAAAHGLASDPDLNEVLRLPGMLSNQQPNPRDDSGEFETAVLAALPKLIDAFNLSRANEGRVLSDELLRSMQRVEALADDAAALRDGARMANIERLRVRITELTQGIAPSDDRLLAEAALLADRSDIEEELVRLRTHATAFVALIEQGGPLGKRLDFLIQELNREANTLLSKTGGASSQNGLRITELGLEIKMEIERAREQIQNLE